MKASSKKIAFAAESAAVRDSRDAFVGLLQPAIDSGHFVWEDAADQYAALVTSWWSEAAKRK